MAGEGPPSCVRKRALSGGCKSVLGLPTKPEAEGNCVIARWGGEQLEAKKQSVGTRTQFGRAVWRASGGRAKPRPAQREACDAEGRCQSNRRERQGGWRQRASKAGQVKRRNLCGSRGRCASDRKATDAVGVTAPIVALKPGNAGGAKGCRKVETRCPEQTERHRWQSRWSNPQVNCAGDAAPNGPRRNRRSGRSGCWRPSKRGSQEGNG